MFLIYPFYNSNSRSFKIRFKIKCKMKFHWIWKYRTYHINTIALLRGVHGMQLEDCQINCQSHPIMDGLSPKQSNAFDCGVFALANVERYLINQTNFPPVSQSLMKLYRCRYLKKLYNLAMDLDVRFWINESIPCYREFRTTVLDMIISWFDI